MQVLNEPKQMDALTDYFSSRRLWEDFSYGTSMSLFELWMVDSGTAIEVRDMQISEKNIHQVFGRDGTDPPSHASKSCLLRLIFFEKIAGASSSLSAKTMARLLVDMELEPAYNYLSSCFADVVAFNNKNGSTNDSVTYSVCYHPKLAFIWNHTDQVATISPRPRLQGIALVETASDFKKVYAQRWKTDVLSHPLFPAFVIGMHLTKRAEDYQNSAKALVREVEVRTGFHSFQNRREVPAVGDLGSLYAQMSGCATKLAGVSRKVAMVDELHDFVLMHCNEHQANMKNGSMVLADLLAVTKRRSRLQKIDNNYILRRVEIQISALCSLICEMDSINSLSIARSSQSIAVSSQQDSSSMKILAVVTMLFLPGSFVAALFSTPIFDWAALDVKDTNVGVGIRPQFGLFWMVVIPLTLLVFVLYSFWLVYQHRMRVRQQHAASSQLHVSWPLSTV